MSDDMKDRLRRLRESREAPTAEKPQAGTSEVEAEGNEDGQEGDSVSRVRASRWPEVSLRLRFQSGKQQALPYFLLQDILYDPDDGVVLVYAHCRVVIRGRSLAPLFDRLADHKVRYVREMEELAADQFPDGETVVTAIQVEKE